jgi:hypothetical protein
MLTQEIILGMNIDYGFANLTLQQNASATFTLFDHLKVVPLVCSPRALVVSPEDSSDSTQAIGQHILYDFEG